MRSLVFGICQHPHKQHVHQLQAKQKMPIGLKLDVGKVMEAANRGHRSK